MREHSNKSMLYKTFWVLDSELYSMIKTQSLILLMEQPAYESTFHRKLQGHLSKKIQQKHTLNEDREMDILFVDNIKKNTPVMGADL